MLKLSPPSKASNPTILRRENHIRLRRARADGRTDFILETPATNPTIQGSTCTSILLTRNGALDTSILRKSVLKCFLASFYDPSVSEEDMG